MSEPASKLPQSKGQSSSASSGNGSRPKPRPPTAGKAGGNGAWSKKNKLRAQHKTVAASHAHVRLPSEGGVPPSTPDELTALAATLDPFDHTPEARARRQEICLLGIQEFGTIKAGLRLANVDRGTYFGWIENFPEFKVAVEHAFMDVADDLEEEVFRRGKDKSDPLLMFAVRRFKPEYRDSFTPREDPDAKLKEEQRSVAALQLRSKLKTLVERREANFALPPAGSEGSEEASDDDIGPPKQLRRAKKKGW